ncbi:MAG TPA: RDD family protein [Thermoanaerobaculia bacterium]
MRFDEIELESVPLGIEDEVAAPPLTTDGEARRGKRLLALLTDLSLFAALALALSPLLPRPYGWLHLAALGGFVVVLSYYYFVGTWMLWGKTIGGAIFDVRVVPADDGAMSLRDASLRWGAVYLSLATAGLGFMLAALPSRRSLPDRVSNTRCV